MEELVRPGSALSKPSLCAECIARSYLEHFYGSSDDVESVVSPKLDLTRDIRPLSMIVAAESCLICCLVVQILQKRAAVHLDNLETSDISIEYTKKRLYLTIPSLEIAIGEVPLEPLFKTDDEYERNTWNILRGAIPMETNIDSSISKHSCRYVPPSCDYSLIKKWLGECFSEHPLMVHFKCNEGRFGKVTLAELRLIDVEHGCIRLMKLPQKYAALSYRWGRETMPEFRLSLDTLSTLSAPGAVTERWPQVPNTIKDAISVCRNCDVPFLWVDAVCIIQDGQDLAEQLEKMTEIYSSAFVTIIAAYGNSSQTGLRGISIPRDFQQQRAEIDGFSMLEALPPFSIEFNHSDWNHRAWTLQEHLFSRRCLLFLEHRVMFQCRWGWLDESIDLEPTSPMDKLTARPKAPRIELYDKFEKSFVSSYPRPLIAKDTSERFYRFLETYFRLDLTNDHDVINACQGTITWFREVDQVQFFWATPTVDLFHGLIFRVYNCRRRKDMPSWSWVGWRRKTVAEVGSIQFDVGYNTGPVYTSDVHFYRYHDGSQLEESASNLKLLSSAMSESRLDRWSASLSLKFATRAKQFTTAEKNRMLVFDALFRCIHFPRDKRYLSQSQRAVSDDQIESNSSIGLVEIGRQWGKGYVRNGAEFWRYIEQSVAQAAICLVISTNASGVSERIGIEVLAIKDWLKMRPKKQWIFLV